MSMKSKIKTFFGPNRQYAVAGASNNPSKFGYKILNWYIQNNLTVIPINPKEQEILGKSVVANVTDIIKAINSHSANLNNHNVAKADGLSISFLTPPSITVQTLKEIAQVENYDKVIKGLWFQPGSYDQEVLDEAEKIGEFEKVIHQDECILVRGEEGLLAANL